HVLGEILRQLGVSVEFDREAHALTLQASSEPGSAPPDDLVRQLRGSFLVTGPLLARVGNVVCVPPGGDQIGRRPVDVHLSGFAALGAQVHWEDGRCTLAAERLTGTRVFLDYPSVVGTENLILAAVLAQGRTTIVNAAMEPEVICLAAMLNEMGAQISGAGANTISIDGVDSLSGAQHTLIPDRIEAGTFAVAAAITGGDILIRGAVPSHLSALLSKLNEIGATIDEQDGGLRVTGGPPLVAANVQAVPYPGLATDLQALVTTLLTQAQGTSVVHERVFEDRLGYVEDLRAMGARIDVIASTATVHGPTPLHGAIVQGRDIRSAASLMLAALAADGTTELRDAAHLARGYEDLDAKLRALGAEIAPGVPQAPTPTAS
ncbi:MAG TPA: UDP-N-acetylglucosamine 1-carboxyvinyltransferase, partial [Dehalococcoidia bacterium]|nr:UDP-N-acetylglucosamine 1-carboxyvinyltransferase [Dehalococcoidia bacterium]